MDMLLTWRNWNFPDFYVVKKGSEGNIWAYMKMDQSEESTTVLW